MVENSSEQEKVLVVDDEASIRRILETRLKLAGYNVATAADGQEALEQFNSFQPDLVILDVMLPKLDGYEVCREIRKTSDTPIIMLTAVADVSNRIQGLEIGADDYVVKPFSVPELMARVKALLRRASPERVGDSVSIGEIELDRMAHRVMRGGREVRLGPTEFRLLDCLMSSPGRVLTRAQLLDNVWGHDVYVDERTVDVHVGRLRKALIRGRERDPIRTVRGVGYAMEG